MKRTYFHGTNADNLESILKYGLSCNEEKIWSVSHDAVYLWEVERVAGSNGEENEDVEYKEFSAFRMASESGQFSCAKAKDCRVVVFKIELDDSEVEIDDSCENMDYANCIRRDILPSEIVEIKISNDLSLIKGYFIGLACGHNSDMSNLYFEDMETRVGKAMLEAIDIEDVEEFIEFEVLEMVEL